MTLKTKKDLAKIYKVSRWTFNHYINKGELFDKLKKTGYYKYCKILTPLQISIIIEHLGDPFD